MHPALCWQPWLLEGRSELAQVNASSTGFRTRAAEGPHGYPEPRELLIGSTEMHHRPAEPASVQTLEGPSRRRLSCLAPQASGQANVPNFGNHTMECTRRA